MVKLILYIDIDAFFAAIEQVTNPRLKGKPVMVGGFPWERGVVACPSYEARAAGVRTAMTLSEAHRLLPDGIFLKGNHENYKTFSDRFEAILLEFSPLVEMISQDEAVVDLSGSARDFMHGETLVRRIKQKIRDELGLSTSAGLAQNRFLAKTASEYRKPDGLTVIPAGGEWDFLSRLPISNVPGIGYKSRHILNDMGIKTIGQLREIPQSYLQKLFGQRGFKMTEFLLNRDPRILEPVHTIKRISRETGFFGDETDMEFIHATLYYLLERACIKLRELGKKCNKLSLKIRYTGEKPISSGKTIPHYFNGEENLMPYARGLFERIHTRRLAINLIGVTLSGLMDAPCQEELFPGPLHKKDNLVHAIDKLRSSFGYHSLYFGKTLSLKENYKKLRTGYELRTPSLSQ
jgi:DNA polymerase-4